MFDETRFLALKTGAEAARGAPHVAIRTSDLAWLIALIETLRAAQVPAATETTG